MTFDSAVGLVLQVTLIIGAIQLLLHVIGTNVYDIRQERRHRRWQKQPYARRLRRRPLVTVVVTAGRHDADNIWPCLMSIAKGSYKNAEVILIDATNGRAAKNIAANFSAVHRALPVRVVTKRADGILAQTVTDAARRHGHGQLLAVMPASCAFGQKSLATAVRYFNDDERLTVLRPAVRVDSAFASFGVLRKYQMLLGLRLQKGRQLFAGAIVSGDVEIRRRHAQLVSKLYFAADVTVYQSSLPFIWSPVTSSFAGSVRGASQWLEQWRRRRHSRSAWTWVAEIMGLALGLSGGLAMLLIPLLAGYFIYLAVVLGQPTYLLSVIGLISVLLLFAIWDDRQLRRPQKLAYSLGIPLAYGYLFGLSIITAAAVTVSLLTPHRSRLTA